MIPWQEMLAIVVAKDLVANELAVKNFSPALEEVEELEASLTIL